MSPRLKDLTERSVWTFAQAFCGFWVAAELDIISPEFDWLNALKLAAVSGGLAVAKAVVAFKFGHEDSAALPETQE